MMAITKRKEPHPPDAHVPEAARPEQLGKEADEGGLSSRRSS